jgi:hypothetical protein
MSSKSTITVMTCEIADCPHEVLSQHRQDDGGHLCATHFYALCSVEGRQEPLAMAEGTRRRYFLNAARIIGQVHREQLITWREKHPRTMQAGQ